MTLSVKLRVTDDPSPCSSEGETHMHWYRPRPREDSRRGIICLPIQGGDYEVSKHFADYFSQRGFHTLRFERRAEWLDPTRSLPDMCSLMTQFLRDIERGVTQWLALEDNPVTRIGLFGVSMGAKIGTMATASDSRIEGAVLCIGGANLEDVIVRGRDDELDTYRNALLEKHGGDLSSLRGALSEAFAAQRITDFAAQAASKPLMMVAARFDRVVPWSESVRLYEALGRPPRMTLPCGHYSAALFVPLIRRRALHFFNTLLRDEG